MGSNIVDLDGFLLKQVEMWICSSKQDAQEKLTNLLLAKEVEQKIAQGRADYNAGRYRTMTKESNAEFIAELEKKYVNSTENNGKI